MRSAVSRVLVVGGAGLLGQYLVDEARRRGHEVLASHRGPPPSGTGAAWLRLDLRDRHAIADVIRDARPEIVINAAAMTDVDACEDRFDEARAVNARAVGALAEASRRAGAAFVHVSTDYVFDGSGPATETTQPRPLNLYGKTKLEGEMLAFAAHPEALLLRLSALFGWNRLSARPNAVTWILDRLRAGEEARLFEDQRVTPTYAGTAAAAAYDLAAARSTGIFHVACRDCLSRVEMGQRIAEVFGIRGPRIVPIPMASVALKAPRPKAPCLVVRKLEETLKRDMPAFRAALDDMKASE